MISDHFSAAQAARLSGLTLTMLNYLCRSNLMMPSSGGSGKGKKRLYSFGDVVVLRLHARLLEAGVSVSRLKKSLQALRKHHAAITLSSLPGSHLVTDGRQVYFSHADCALEELTSGQFAFAFVLELAKLRQEVVDKLDADELRKAS